MTYSSSSAAYRWLAQAFFVALNGWLSPLIVAVVAFVLFLFRKSLTDAILYIVFTRSRRRDAAQYQMRKETVQQSLGYLIPTAFFAVACHMTPEIREPWGSIITRAANSLLVAAVFWFIYKAAFLVVVHRKRKAGAPLGASAATFLASMLRVLIVVVGFFIILSFWVSNLSGLVAGLGIGGLAISLAAQDSIGNLIGSLSILMDGTFKVGDYIETAEFSGTVEKIGIRTSKVCDFNGARVSVPNKILAQSVVTNATERKRRRIEVRVTVSRSASVDAFASFQSRVLEMLGKHEDIERPPIVVLEGLVSEGLVLYVTCFAGADFGAMLQTRNDICREIAAIAEEMRIPLYSPNRMLVVPKDDGLRA